MTGADLALDGLCAWRIARLVTEDEITKKPRTAAIDWTLRNKHPQLRYLITCPHCVSPYCVILLLCLRTVAPRASRPLIHVLAISGFVSLSVEIVASLGGSKS